MEFIQDEMRAKIKDTLENGAALRDYAENQQNLFNDESKKFAALYPANTVKPRPINYCHFRFALDELMLNMRDVRTVLSELGIKSAKFLGFANPDKEGYTYACYKWKEQFFFLFPLCQDFFFVTEDVENRLKETWGFSNCPIVTVRVMHQLDTNLLVQAAYKIKGEELVMERIYCPKGGPYLLNEHEDIEKIRNLMHYLREEFVYDMNREKGHTDLPNSVRIN